MSCPLGKLYNKEAIISFLLNPPDTATGYSGPYGNDGYLVASHIRSLKDVITLNLTPNPALNKDSHNGNHSNNNAPSEQHETTFGTTESKTPANYVCPISLREMNGSVKFIYRKPCGCVMSESSMKEMRKFDQQSAVIPASTSSTSTTDDAATRSSETSCPVDAAHKQAPEEWVTINPIGEELQSMKEAWELRKLQDKEAKKSAKERKRKDKDSGGSKEPGEPKVKKVKTASSSSGSASSHNHPAPSIKAGATVPLLSASLAAKIAEQKKAHSPAIASLYAKKGGDDNHVSLFARV